jgi:DNA-binding response OmpR family regulator
MKKIMIVDDEPDVTFLIKEMLGREGFCVVEANSGKEALEKIDEEKPDLVLLDIMMPDMDGWEVSRKIKENEKTKDTLVSMYSVKFEDEDKVLSFDYGLADWHIKKSLDRERFVKDVRWLLTNPLKRISYPA